jgi:hypothetical protein
MNGKRTYLIRSRFLHLTTKQPRQLLLRILCAIFILALAVSSLFWTILGPRSATDSDSSFLFGDFYSANMTNYCLMTNPVAGAASGGRVTCLRHSPEAVTLVATVAEAELLDAEQHEAGGGWNLIRWIDELPFGRRVLYIKSNATVAFRRNGMQWDLSSRRSERVARETARLLRGEPAFRSVARAYPWRTHSPSAVELREAPNVGDEALSIADFVARGSMISKFNIFVHGHREAWHAPDVVEQLGCVCVDESRERYRTLTTPTHAFLLQCMPFHVDEEAAMELMAGKDRFPANEDLVAYRRRQVQRSANASRTMAQAFRQLIRPAISAFRGSTKDADAPGGDSKARDPGTVSKEDGDLSGSGEMPAAVVRDCCASFIATDEAIRGSADRFDWLFLRRAILAQPSPLFTVDGEISMYLERFWRFLMQPSAYDFQRDFAQVRCKYSSHFECPPEVNISGERDVLPEVRAKPCASMLHNRFG